MSTPPSSPGQVPGTWSDLLGLAVSAAQACGLPGQPDLRECEEGMSWRQGYQVKQTTILDHPVDFSMLV